MTAISTTTEGDLSKRKAPVIPASFVTLNTNGFIWREFLVRLPSGFIADDLKEPGIWTLVQYSSNSLVRHDRLYMVAFDESWVAEAIVADATKEGVVLAKPRITQFPPRYSSLFQTEEYRVVWYGVGYCVERKKDSKRMTSPVSSAALAERELVGLYPKIGGSA